jgi:hypothetical protein
MGLYMLAARELPGSMSSAGCISRWAATSTAPGRDRGQRRPRPARVSNDRLASETFEELLGDVLAEALKVVAEIRAGRLGAPQTLRLARPGCSFPSICRCEAT